MSTLFIDRRGAEVDVDSDIIVVRTGGEQTGRVPLAAVERVVVRGKARLSTGLLTRLAERGVGLLVLGGRRHLPSARLSGGPGADAALRIAQVHLLDDEPRRRSIAGRILLAKITGQHRLISELETQGVRGPATRAALEALSAASRKFERGRLTRKAMLGVEGAAAAAYFRAFACAFAPGLGFAGRNRRPPRDPVNACLSLGYTLLHADAVREAAAQGFDPMIGVLHEIAHGRESLACDMTEPLRALVDRFVVELFRGGHLRADSFSRKGPACLLGKAARKTYFTRWEEEAAPLARRLLVRGLRDLGKVVRASGAAPALPPPGQRRSTGDAPP